MIKGDTEKDSETIRKVRRTHIEKVPNNKQSSVEWNGLEYKYTYFFGDGNCFIKYL